MKTDREILAIETAKKELADLKSQLQSVNSTVAAMTLDGFDWSEFDFDPEHLSDAMADYISEVYSAMVLMTEEIEAFDNEEE
jgi:hypothetical protein